jgi:hypothetical protein
MRKLFAVAAVILIATITVGCLDQAHENPTLSPAATTALNMTAPAVVNRSDYATFTCQLNMTRGSGLDNKEIRWAIDNVYKETSRTIWGFATFNLTVDQTQDLTIGKHVITATFAGDNDYAGSNATTTFQVQAAPTPTPSPSTATPRPGAEKPSIALSVPPTVSIGNAHLTGTFSGLLGNQNAYVLVRQAGAATWTVYAPLLQASGQYSVDVSFTAKGNADLDAIITTSTLNSGSSISTLPTTLTKSETSTTVK